MKSLLVTLVFAAAVTVASAQLANLTFETGDFTGWTASKGAFVFTQDDDPFITQREGHFYAGLLPKSSIVRTTGIYLRTGQTVSVWMNGIFSGPGSLDLTPNSGPTIHVPWEQSYVPGTQFPDKWNPVSFKIQQDGFYQIGASNQTRFEGPAYLGVDLFTITPVPESSFYGLLAAVLGVAAIMGRRRKASAAAAA